MTNNEKAVYIIHLIEETTKEIQEFPMRRKQLLLLRSHLENRHCPYTLGNPWSALGTECASAP